MTYELDKYLDTALRLFLETPSNAMFKGCSMEQLPLSAQIVVVTDAVIIKHATVRALALAECRQTVPVTDHA